MNLPERDINHNDDREQQGQVACCNCGHSSDPVWSENYKGWRRIWHCESCGALIKARQRSYLREVLLFLPVLFLVTPFFGIVVYLAGMISENLARLLFLISLINWPFFAWALTRATIDRFFGQVMTVNVEPHGICLRCDYDLNGTIGDHCPECGAPTTGVRDAIEKWRKSGPQSVIKL